MFHIFDTSLDNSENNCSRPPPFSFHILNRSRSNAQRQPELLLFIFLKSHLFCVLFQRVCPSLHSMRPLLPLQFTSNSGLFQRVFFAQKHDIQQHHNLHVPPNQASAVGIVINLGFTLHSAFPKSINHQSFSISILSTSLIFCFSASTWLPRGCVDTSLHQLSASCNNASSLVRAADCTDRHLHGRITQESQRVARRSPSARRHYCRTVE